ncbi:MAG: heavy-metal-associated domain-containing protein [Candidatus Dadabacteria bacterium]|nr:heavy-metal-associated domain-containing protein [Candidatus Dadabacteria bacterium]
MRAFILGLLVILAFLTSSLFAEERKTLELRVFGICSTCGNDVELKVMGIPGLQEVNVDIAKKKVRAGYNPELVSETKIVLALRRAGYEVRRPFDKSRVEKAALGISGVKNNDDINEIEGILYAYFDVDQVEVSKGSDNIIAIVDYKKGGLDPKQFILTLKGILPELEIEVLKNLDMIKAQVNKEKLTQN